MKNKKTITISIFVVLIVGFISLYNSLNILEVGDNDNYFNKQLKRIVPENIKEYMKDTIFVFKKKSFLEQKLLDKDKELAFKDRKITELKNKLIDLGEIEQIFEFKKKQTKSKKLGNINLLLKKFNLPLLQLTGPRSYLSYYNQNLFLITGTGILMYTSIDNLKDEKFVFERIDSNFKDIVGQDYIQEEKPIVKNLLIKNNKIYVSYQKKAGNECFTNEILVSDLKFEKIIFDEFFDTNECQPFFDTQTGGNLSEYKNNKILMTIGDYHYYTNKKVQEVNGLNNAQTMNGFLGKIISIDKKTKEYEIISMGHRNPQGLYYDEENNIIYSTEHGPYGGDEINVNTSPDGEIKNYGWGISSYGEHYGFPDVDNSENYEIAPLHKSHEKYGFIEPLKYFVPSIAPTQIIKTEQFINIPNKNIIYIAALGGDIEEGDMSVHQFILNSDLKIEQHNILPVGERIRDMVYVEELNKIFLFLESTGSIGMLEIEN